MLSEKPGFHSLVFPALAAAAELTSPQEHRGCGAEGPTDLSDKNKKVQFDLSFSLGQSLGGAFPWDYCSRINPDAYSESTAAFLRRHQEGQWPWIRVQTVQESQAP